jgi:hypothetical protein
MVDRSYRAKWNAKLVLVGDPVAMAVPLAAL